MGNPLAGKGLKDETAADVVRKQMNDLRFKISITVQPIFVSQKLD